MALFRPLLREIPVHGFKNFCVLGIFATVVPKPVNNQLFTSGVRSKGETVIQILGKGNGKVIGFKGMEGDIDLMKGRGAQQHLLLLF